jgi:hypothetical protein
VIYDSFYYEGKLHGPRLAVFKGGNFAIGMFNDGEEKSRKNYAANATPKI